MRLNQKVWRVTEAGAYVYRLNYIRAKRADAILDRLMHNAHRLLLKGESMRKILGQLTEDEHLR